MGSVHQVRWWITTGVALAVALLSATGTLKGAERPTLIQPGAGVGELRLGQTVDEAIKVLGARKADAAWETGTGNAKEVSLSYTDLGVTLVFDSKEQLCRIVVKNPGLLAERTWIRVGSKADEVLKLYGTGVKKAEPRVVDQGLLLEYPKSGVGFVINPTEGKVEEIRVMKKAW